MKKIALVEDTSKLKAFTPEVPEPTEPAPNEPLTFVLEFIDLDGERKVEQFPSSQDRLTFIDQNQERISSPRLYVFADSSAVALLQSE